MRPASVRPVGRTESSGSRRSRTDDAGSSTSSSTRPAPSLEAAPPRRASVALLGSRAVERVASSRSSSSSSSSSSGSASVPALPARARALGKNASNVTPPLTSTSAGQAPDALRRARYKLRDKLRALALTERVRLCGRSKIAPTVQVVRRDGRASLRGVSTCASVWVCPCCQVTIQSERAEEVGKLMRWHEERGGLVFMLTLTLRHHRRASLGRTLDGVAQAWRRFTRGAPWARFASAARIVGSVRALEVTHGARGWHPHLHALLLVEPLDVRHRGTDERIAHPFADASGPSSDWMAERWADCVERELGKKHRPSLVRGLDLAPARSSSYLTKLGLEVAAGGSKGSRDPAKGRGPWELAADAVAGDEEAASLWRAFSASTFRRRQLTWSRGLRERAGIEEVSDERAAAREALGPVELVADLDASSWRAVLASRSVLGLIEAAELPAASAAVAALVERALRAIDPD